MISRRFLRIKVLKALYAYVNSGEDSLIASQKRMLFSVSKSYELYHMMFRLMADLAEYTREVDSKRSKKHTATEEERNPSYRFVNNPLIAKIRSNEPINEFLSKNKLSWSRDNELFKQLYERLNNAEYYKEYLAKEQLTWRDERKVVVDFLRNEIEDNELFYSLVEDMSIYWIDEIEFFTSKVASQLSKQQEKAAIEIKPLYTDEEDMEFAKDLFVQSILRYDDNVELIRNYAKNWDVERITVIDRLIIIMAIVEISQMPNIPTTVTLDEYIEIAKHFSTNNSNIFINGILHKYISERGESK